MTERATCGLAVRLDWAPVGQRRIPIRWTLGDKWVNRPLLSTLLQLANGHCSMVLQVVVRSISANSAISATGLSSVGA